MLVHYKVKYYSEVDDDEAVDEGLTVGNTLGEAVDKIADYYGKKNVFSVEVYECEDCLSYDELKDMVNEDA